MLLCVLDIVVVQVTLEGQSSGFFGERVKFTCCFHDFGTKIIGAQTYACAAYYQESGPNLFQLMAAVPGQEDSEPTSGSGNVAINGIKLGSTNWVNSEFDGQSLYVVLSTRPTTYLLVRRLDTCKRPSNDGDVSSVHLRRVYCCCCLRWILQAGLEASFRQVAGRSPKRTSRPI
jgi:hypothetical protein